MVVRAFTYAVIFRCRIFRLPNFLLPIFSGCRFFRGLFRFRYFRQFCVALFSYRVNFRCRIFLLPNFPVAISSVAVFSVALFFVAVISHINFVLPCFPTLSFFVADFSYCPIFR